MSYRCLPLAVILSSVCLFTLDASAGEPHLEKFEPFIGQWVFQGPTKQKEHEAGDALQQGTPVVVVRDMRWVLNNHAISFDWSLRAGNAPAITCKHLIVWDKASAKITCFSQRSDGIQGTTDWSFEGDTLVGKVRNVKPDGTKMTVTVYHQMEDSGDSYLWWSTDIVEGGEKFPDSAKYRFVRSK